MTVTVESNAWRRLAKKITNVDLRREVCDAIRSYETALSLSRGPNQSRREYWEKLAEARREKAKELLGV